MDAHGTMRDETGSLVATVVNDRIQLRQPAPALLALPRFGGQAIDDECRDGKPSDEKTFISHFSTRFHWF